MCLQLTRLNRIIHDLKFFLLLHYLFIFYVWLHHSECQHQIQYTLINCCFWDFALKMDNNNNDDDNFGLWMLAKTVPDWHAALTGFRWRCSFCLHLSANAHGPWWCSGTTWRTPRRWHALAVTTSNAMHSRQVPLLLCALALHAFSFKWLALGRSPSRSLPGAAVAIERYWILYFMLVSSGLLCTSRTHIRPRTHTHTERRERERESLGVQFYSTFATSCNFGAHFLLKLLAACFCQPA